jgi:hypothetical protein
MIVGAEKSGTSSLARYLEQHPNICSHKQREMTYFVNDEEYAQGYEKIYSRYFVNCKNENSILLAKSVGVMYWAEAVKRLWDHNPECQVVAILRNPVDRAYSAYWYARRMGWEDLKTFEEAIAAEPIRLKENGIKRQHCTYIDRGLYHRQISGLLENFGKGKTNIFLFEKIRDEPLELCRVLYQTMKIISNFTPSIELKHNEAMGVKSEKLAKLIASRKPILKLFKRLIPDDLAFKIKEKTRTLNNKPFCPPPMNLATKKFLIEYFEPFNKELSQLINQDLNSWSK